ncbi:Importin-11 [Rhynchospora pubera]|uniref:Importin-11 n=1 Tax=Rhynchospora pubera TaxID=906938 RepID=A0AAV8FI10_9POAL|nr:Importin-11 [Rhynchospora pubera]
MALSADDVQAMYSLLLNSLSSDVAIRQPAEAALSQCENRPGFCSCLLEIITKGGAAGREDVRLLASVYFKNSISRYWRQRRDSLGISNEEKIHLRKNLLLHIREENTQIAHVLAVLVSKIARIDYPKEWPDLFSFLAQQLQTTDILASHRVTMVLFRTLKELSTKRLSADTRNFSQITASLFEYTWNFWKKDVQTILQNFSSLSQCSNIDSILSSDLGLIGERWFFGLKIVRQLIVSGYESDTTSAQEVWQVKEVCPTLLSAIQSFLPYYYSFRDRHAKLWEFTKRACIKLTKVLIVIQNRHPYSFGHQTVLPTIVDFCLNIITNPDQAGLAFEEFLIECMILVKSVLECKEYRQTLTGRVIDQNGGTLTLEDRKKTISAAVNDMMKTILPNDRVVLLCNILIRRHFMYTAKDLDDWNRYPESFHHEQNLVQWTEKQKPCAEALFIVLFEKYKEILAPVVVSILHEAMSASPPMETELTPGMLLKDAAYTAAGHVYYELSNYLNFNEWFHGSLSIELTNEHPNMRIIHRKIALLVGQWISEIKGDTRKLVYHALIKLLQDRDAAVSLAACSSLCYLVQDMNSSEQDLLELLPLCWPLCFKLMDDVQEFDSKVQVLNLISILIEHVGEKVMPYANQLCQFFYKLWEESTGESILQMQLLVALKSFVCSLGYQSQACYDMILPILQNGINVDSPDSLNLLEDAIQLWETTLSNASSVPPQILDLFPYLVSIVERSLDHLEVVVSIMEDYIVLCGAEFLKRHASSLVKVLDTIIGNVNDKGLLSTLAVVDILVQLFPMEAPPLITSVLQKLVYISLSGDDVHEPTKTIVCVTAGAILARVLVMNTNYIAQLTSEPSLVTALQQAGITLKQNILLCLVDIWVDKMDNAASLQRKAYGLALAIILTLRVPEVLDKLDDILSVCTSVIIGATKEDQSEDESSGDITSYSENIGYAATSSKEFRKRQIKDSDPIKQLSLEDMLRENLKTCSSLHGEAVFNTAISRIHPSAFAQLQRALKMT